MATASPRIVHTAAEVPTWAYASREARAETTVTRSRCPETLEPTSHVLCVCIVRWTASPRRNSFAGPLWSGKLATARVPASMPSRGAVEEPYGQPSAFLGATVAVVEQRAAVIAHIRSQAQC